MDADLARVTYFGPEAWFGASASGWDAPRCSLPPGEDCVACDGPLVAGDAGIAMPYFSDPDSSLGYMHARCFIELVNGRIRRLQGLADVARDLVAPFVCPCCGSVSQHPIDAVEGYCGCCHAWTGRKDPQT